MTYFVTNLDLNWTLIKSSHDHKEKPKKKLRFDFSFMPRFMADEKLFFPSQQAFHLIGEKMIDPHSGSSIYKRPNDSKLDWHLLTILWSNMKLKPTTNKHPVLHHLSCFQTWQAAQHLSFQCHLPTTIQNDHMVQSWSMCQPH